jgi:phospholipid/cholesterol/gamma-HCH transport system substrate-binding protein
MRRALSMKKLGVETAVGAFVIIGFTCFAFLAIKLGSIEIFESDRYTVSARFDSVEGLKPGAPVEIAGVRVGVVDAIRIDAEEFEAVVRFSVEPEINIPTDSIASIRTSGIIGDKFLKITPGADEEYLADGSELFETESSISIEELVSKYIFEKD